ncbi:hypothetical protein BH09BAC2_BH09BAC2_01270 [soil metagenome]
MVIAVNTADFLYPQNTDPLLFSFWQNMAANHPKHQFIFVSFVALGQQSHNVKSVVVKSVSSSSFLSWFTYKQSLKYLLKKNKVDIFITAYPFQSSANTVWLLPSPVVFYLSEWSSKMVNQFYKKHADRFQKKADAVITGAIDSTDCFKFNNKTDNIFGLNLNAPQTLERETIKEKFADGNEYFLFFAGGTNLEPLVTYFKAFSFFKKRQKSSMKLILLADNVQIKMDIERQMQSYKYKSEVKINHINTDVFEMIQGAYAVVMSPFFNSFIDISSLSFMAQVPLLAPEKYSIGAPFADKILRFNETNKNDIAEKMMLIFKDEKLRKDLTGSNHQMIQKTKPNDQQYHHLVTFLESIS